MRADRWLAALAPMIAAAGIGACTMDLGKIFDRDDPKVEEARRALEASVSGSDADLAAARMALEEVLQWRCDTDGGRDLVIDRPNASLDLGLVLFRISELVGRRFGEEEIGADAQGEEAESVTAARAAQLDCAHLLLLKIANDPATPKDLALRAQYLLGNFEFLSRRYKQAIAEYDAVLLAHPARGTDPQGEVGAPSDDDAVARDAAWNRAIALKRLNDQDAGADADTGSEDGGGQDSDADSDGSNDSDADANETPEASPDSGGDGGNDGDAGQDTAPDGGDTGDKGRDGGADAQNDKGDSESKGEAGDGGVDAQTNPPPPQPSNSASPPPMPSSAVDLRELDRFDKKAPLDLDLPQKFKERKHLPKGMDK